MLVARGYKAGELRVAIEYGLDLDREAALEKVSRKNRGE